MQKELLEGVEIKLMVGNNIRVLALHYLLSKLRLG
jgi:hypothetical protein